MAAKKAAKNGEKSMGAVKAKAKADPPPIRLAVLDGAAQRIIARLPADAAKAITPLLIVEILAIIVRACLVGRAFHKLRLAAMKAREEGGVGRGRVRRIVGQWLRKRKGISGDRRLVEIVSDAILAETISSDLAVIEEVAGECRLFDELSKGAL